MKKIKISEQQAKMLKDLGKTKVLKITQEQYSRIVEVEKLNEEHQPIELAFRQNLSNAARKDFNKSKINEVSEMYESFISELYGVNENTEKKHDKLIKLMELAGLVNENRLVKEKFNNDKKIVEYVMCEALYEMYNGCSEYKAMEIIEQQLDLFKDYQGKPEVVNVDDESYKERLENWLENNQNHDNYRYFKNKYDNGNEEEIKLAVLDTTRLKEDNAEHLLENESQIIGNDIINYEPFVNLPETRDEVDWSNRGEAKLPSLKDGDVSMSILEKETVKQWIAAFINEYKEEPIFNILPEVSRYQPIKVEVINQSFNDWQDNYISGKASELEKFSSKDETTTAGSSGAYVGGLNMNTPINKTNVVDELINDEVSDIETKIDPETEVLYDVVDLLSSVVRSPSVKPEEISKNSYVLIKAINVLKQIDTDNIMFSYFLPDLIKKLIYYSRNISDEGVFEDYIHHIKYCYQTINALNDDINVKPFPYEEDLLEQGIGNSGQYDTPGFDNPSMTGDTPRGTGPTWKKPTIAGGKEVKVKEKCSEFPYCNQGPDAIEISK